MRLTRKILLGCFAGLTLVALTGCQGICHIINRALPLDPPPPGSCALEITNKGVWVHWDEKAGEWKPIPNSHKSAPGTFLPMRDSLEELNRKERMKRSVKTAHIGIRAWYFWTGQIP